jgi:site-specific DNA recombinase
MTRMTRILIEERTSMAAKVRQNRDLLPNGKGHFKLRGVLYARVSSEEQRERQTIQTQIDTAKSWFEREGIELVHVYKDEGVSGTVPLEERPDGRRLLEDGQAKKFDLVAVYKVDRLGRADLVAHVARHHLETLGVGLRSITEPFDLSNPYGRFMFAQFASFAALERSNFLERSKAGTARLVKTGIWVSGIVPYGYYRGEDRFLHINETLLPGTTVSEAEVVRMMYRWATEGQSTLKIARMLNAMGIPPHYVKDGRLVQRGKRKVHTSGKWFAGRVRNLLRNETYMGVHHWGKRTSDRNKPKELIRREVPAIVSPEVWQQAKDALRKNYVWSPRNSKNNYLLKGMLKCGFCDRNMTGYQRGRIQYRCNSQLTHVKDAFGPCSGRHLSGVWIEGLVWNELKDWILNYTNLEAVITDALREQDQERQVWEKTLGQMRKEIEAKGQEKDRIITLYRKGLLSDSDLERQLGIIETEAKHVRQAADDLEQRHRLFVNPEEVITTIRKQLADFRKAIRKGDVPFATKRKIVEQFVKEVRVYLKKRGRGAPKENLLFVEAVPFRANGTTTDTPAMNRQRVWERPGNKTPSKQPEEGKIHVVYNFPFPPNPQRIMSITNYMGTDSSRTPA